jgi:hypothetical protein
VSCKADDLDGVINEIVTRRGDGRIEKSDEFQLDPYSSRSCTPNGNFPMARPLMEQEGTGSNPRLASSLADHVSLVGRTQR